MVGALSQVILQFGVMLGTGPAWYSARRWCSEKGAKKEGADRTVASGLETRSRWAVVSPTWKCRCLPHAIGAEHHVNDAAFPSDDAYRSTHAQHYNVEERSGRTNKYCRAASGFGVNCEVLYWE